MKLREFPMEPHVGRYAHPVTLYLAATRPAFLAATLVACLLGLASVAQGGNSVAAFPAIITIGLALLVHAAINVLNDYYDALSGTDGINTKRIFPFTGGSRFIQNGVLSLEQTARFGYGLMLISMLGGLWLSFQSGIGLLVIGGAGLLIGWAYSASPLSLNGRGLGELCVLLGFMGVIIGANYVQCHAFSWQPVIVGLAYALLVTNLLYINQFPDREADRIAGKHHWVARLSPEYAAIGYPILALFAFCWLLLCVLNHWLSAWTLLSTLPMVFSIAASTRLLRHAQTPENLRPAIQFTLAAMLGHGLLLTIILFVETA